MEADAVSNPAVGVLPCPVISDQRTRSRAFAHVLGNTAAAMLGTAFIWFGLTFWAYLETRSVLVTSFMGGGYMLLLAVLGVPFGALIDRHRKHTMMIASAAGTVVSYLLAVVVFVLTPDDALVDIGRPWFWLFAGLVLFGSLLAMIRGLALSPGSPSSPCRGSSA